MPGKQREYEAWVTEIRQLSQSREGERFLTVAEQSDLERLDVFDSAGLPGRSPSHAKMRDKTAERVKRMRSTVRRLSTRKR